MTSGWDTIIVAALSGGLLTALVNWFFNRRRAKIDLLQVQVDTLLSIITGQEKYIKALELRVEKLEKRVHEQDLIIQNFKNGKQ